MSLRTGLLKTVEAARKLSGPTFADIRVNQVTIRTRTWTGARIRQGTSSDSDLALPAHYPVRFIKQDEIDSSGGQFKTGDILVDHITPSDGAGVGFTPPQLRPVITTNNIEVLYIVTGPLNGEYTGVDVRLFRPFTYQLILRRRANP